MWPVTREMQLKTKMRYHFISIKMAKVKKTDSTNGWQACEKQTLKHCWWECKMVQPLWKNSMVVTYKVKHMFYHMINKSTPRYLPQNKVTQHSHTKTGIWMFITLFIIAPNWKQPQCPIFWMDEQIVVFPYL